MITLIIYVILNKKQINIINIDEFHLIEEWSNTMAIKRWSKRCNSSIKLSVCSQNKIYLIFLIILRWSSTEKFFKLIIYQHRWIFQKAFNIAHSFKDYNLSGWFMNDTGNTASMYPQFSPRSLRYSNFVRAQEAKWLIEGESMELILTVIHWRVFRCQYAHKYS